MSKRSFAILGLILFLLGVAIGLFLLSGSLQASALDSYKSLGPGAGVPCPHPLEQVGLNRRTMAEKESQALTVVLGNLDSSADCEVTVSLSAPNFDINPANPDRVVTVPAGEKAATTAWVLSSREAGNYEVVVTAGFDVQVMGIRVTNLLGLSAPEAKILSYIGYFLGPMLSLPWWIEKWEEHQRRKREEEQRRPSPPAPSSTSGEGG